MELIDLYTQYRNAEFILINEKILKTLNREILHDSAKVLNMLDKKGNISFRDDKDVAYLLDFAIFDYRVEGRNAVERYIENYGAENEIEEKVLKALLSSYTSLFRVVNVSPIKHMIFLKDSFNQQRNTRIIDMGLSQREDMEALVFTRVLPFPELNMTSGASLVFSRDMEIFLADNYNKIKEQFIENESANKYIWFYHLYMQYGLDIHFHDIDHEHHDHEHDHHDHGNHTHDHHHHDHECECGHHH